MRRLGLRTRVVAMFAGGALILSASIVFLSYELTRESLLGERERTATRTTYFDATVVAAGLRADHANTVDLLRSLDTGAQRKPVIMINGRLFSRSADPDPGEAVPASLRHLVASGRPGMQRIRTSTGPALVLGVPLSSTTQFYEIHSLKELDQTLNVLALILAMVAAGTTVAGAGLGWYATHHALRPLTSVTQAAQGIAGGDLSARLDPSTEPDVRLLTSSFNDMVDQLSQRMERDRRFAADVSHELRSPLQTLAAAAEVLVRRSAHLDARSAEAAQLVADEVGRFRHLVADLLELSRSDQDPDKTTVDVGRLARHVCRTRGIPPDIVEADGHAVWHVDRRRLVQIIGNLLDNAQRYGGGPVAVRLADRDDFHVIEVDDEGPGVIACERTLIFQPFVRGRGALARADGEGTGLGLALVAQHAHAHGGDVEATDRPGGGARFRVNIPVEPT